MFGCQRSGEVGGPARLECTSHLGEYAAKPRLPLGTNGQLGFGNPSYWFLRAAHVVVSLSEGSTACGWASSMSLTNSPS